MEAITSFSSSGESSALTAWVCSFHVYSWIERTVNMFHNFSERYPVEIFEFFVEFWSVLVENLRLCLNTLYKLVNILSDSRYWVRWLFFNFGLITDFIVFNRQYAATDDILSLNGFTVGDTPSVENLGVMLSNDFMWKVPIWIRFQIEQSFLHNLRHVLSFSTPSRTKLQFYKAYILPTLWIWRVACQ